MDKIQKKRLYESIMKSISKTVKGKLNEDYVDEDDESEATYLCKETSKGDYIYLISNNTFEEYEEFLRNHAIKGVYYFDEFTAWVITVSPDTNINFLRKLNNILVEKNEYYFFTYKQVKLPNADLYASLCEYMSKIFGGKYDR